MNEIIDGRPEGLIKHVQNSIEDTDKIISDGLDVLTKDALALKRKPTMVELIKITGLAERTITKREWANARVKTLKTDVKKLKRKKKPTESTTITNPSEGKSNEQLLTERVNSLLKENAILYDEVIGLQEALSRRDKEIEALIRRNKIKQNN